MKKILMGLLAISSLAFATIEGGATIPEGAPTFTKGESVSVQVQGTLRTEVEIVKYVVFVQNEGETNSLILNFGDFMIKTYNGEGANTGFQTVVPSVVVKRLSRTNSFTELEQNEKIETYYETSYPALNNWLITGKVARYNPTQLLPEVVLNEMITKLNTDESTKTLGTFSNINGCIVLNDIYVFTPSSVFGLNNGQDAETNIKSVTFKSWSASASDARNNVPNGVILESEKGALVQKLFDGGVAVDGSLKIRVSTGA